MTHLIASAEFGGRQETAVLLTGTAREFGIDQHAIKTTSAGFVITDELMDVLYDEGVIKKTSGNRAAKNTGTEQE